MAIVALKCPNCGADLEFDDGREFGFCQFCGTKVMIESQKVINNRTVNKNRNTTVINNYYGSSKKVQIVDSRPKMVEVEIVRGKCFNDSFYSFVVVIDGTEVAKLKRGRSQKIALAEGVHNVEIATPGTTGPIYFKSTAKIEGDTLLETGFEGKVIRKIYLNTVKKRFHSQREVTQYCH